LDITGAKEALGGISTPTVYRLHERGELPFVKIAGRTFVRVADVERLIEKGLRRTEKEEVPA
jgi:excisionase family DNA binding protein